MSTNGPIFSPRRAFPCQTLTCRAQTSSAARPDGASCPPTPQGSGDRKQKTSIKHRLSVVAEAWDDFQTSRRRDAVYGFLSAVFTLVQRHAKRGRKRRLLRELRGIIGTKAQPATDPFTLIIRAVAEADGIDRKTVSKWSRALRYVAKVKPTGVSVRAFMQHARWGQRVRRAIRRIFPEGQQDALTRVRTSYCRQNAFLKEVIAMKWTTLTFGNHEGEIAPRDYYQRCGLVLLGHRKGSV